MKVLHCFTNITNNSLIDDIDLDTVIRVAQSKLFLQVQIIFMKSTTSCLFELSFKCFETNKRKGQRDRG